MSLIAVYNGLIMNRLLEVNEGANQKTWVESISRIIETTPKLG